MAVQLREAAGTTNGWAWRGHDVFSGVLGASAGAIACLIKSNSFI
jgi:hypothetical protein